MLNEFLVVFVIFVVVLCFVFFFLGCFFGSGFLLGIAMLIAFMGFSRMFFLFKGFSRSRLIGFAFGSFHKILRFFCGVQSKGFMSLTTQRQVKADQPLDPSVLPALTKKV